MRETENDRRPQSSNMAAETRLTAAASQHPRASSLPLALLSSSLLLYILLALSRSLQGLPGPRTPSCSPRRRRGSEREGRGGEIPIGLPSHSLFPGGSCGGLPRLSLSLSPSPSSTLRLSHSHSREKSLPVLRRRRTLHAHMCECVSVYIYTYIVWRTRMQVDIATSASRRASLYLFYSLGHSIRSLSHSRDYSHLNREVRVSPSLSGAHLHACEGQRSRAASTHACSAI